MTITSNTHISENPEATQALAAQFGASLSAGAILALNGQLGAGKTCFVQGLAQALNIQEIVNSPTYTIIHEYQGTPPLYHIDLYRINDVKEALNLGLEEYLPSDGITAIEWPERAASLLPKSTISIRFERGATSEQRLITIDLPSSCCGKDFS